MLQEMIVGAGHLFEEAVLTCSTASGPGSPRKPGPGDPPSRWQMASGPITLASCIHHPRYRKSLRETLKPFSSLYSRTASVALKPGSH